VQTTHVYVEADLQMKENALSHHAPIGTNVRRFKADDSLTRRSRNQKGDSQKVGFNKNLCNMLITG
jgi:hypothetical protein